MLMAILDFLFGIPQAGAAEYVLSGANLTSVGGAATDVANSLVGNMAALLPVFVPLLVVGFIISMVIRNIKTR